MFLLTKNFSKLDYALQFMDGKLYMNSLAYFRENGFEEQKDLFEGVIGKVAPSDIHNIDFEFLSHQKTDIRLVACGYEFCNVCCFSMQKAEIFGRIAKITPSCDMSGFGKYVVVIDNFQTFVRRVLDKAKEQGFDCICGPVKYHNPQVSEGPNILLKTDKGIDLDTLNWKVSKHHDAFDKNDFYAGQQEWRIALYNGQNNMQPFVLDLGCRLDDIAHMVKDSELNIDNEIIGNKERNCDYRHYGSITRKDMMNKFLKLGDNKVYFLSIFG